MECAGFTVLPDKFDGRFLNEDAVFSAEELQLFSEHYFTKYGMEDYLNMNLASKLHKQQSLASPAFETCKQLNMELQYFHLKATLCKLLESYDRKMLIDKCTSLMVTFISSVTLFDSTFLEELDKCYNTVIILNKMMQYSTWCDYSIVETLIKICDCFEGAELLKQFENQINFTASLNDYLIPAPSSRMIPSESSPYTLMTTKYVHKGSELVVQSIGVIKSLITKVCKMSSSGCQFLAISYTDHETATFYWQTQKKMVTVISNEILNNLEYLFKCGITEIALYPNVIIYTGKDVTNIESFAALYTDSDKHHVSLLQVRM